LIVDVHAHVLPEQAVQRMQRESREHAPDLRERTADDATLVMGAVSYSGFRRGGWDLEQRLAELDAHRLDAQLLAPVPFAFGYELDPSLATTFAQIQNEELAAFVRSSDRLAGLATLPLQAPDAAAVELRRAVGTLGLRGAELGTQVQGVDLDDPRFEVVWAAAEETAAFLFVHPWQVAGADRLRDFYLTNVVGNPFETTIAIARLVLGGVLQRFPRLTFCFAHGGGFLPYQRGRLEHAWEVQPEARRRLSDAPASYLDRLYVDSVLFSPEALELAVRMMGAEHVLLGSDYPFRMGLDDPLALLAAADLSETDRRRIAGETAARLLGFRS
jgi:aminocarboxymuconate-semialdehyde decarboxylase